MFLLARHEWGRQWNLVPRRTCVQYQTHPECTWANGRENSALKLCVKRRDLVSRRNPSRVQAVFPKGKTLRLFWLLSGNNFLQQTKQKIALNYDSRKTSVRSDSLNIPSQPMTLGEFAGTETGVISENADTSQVCHENKSWGNVGNFPLSWFVTVTNPHLFGNA